MFYRILRRVFRKHAAFHLVIPLVMGVLVEVFYERHSTGRPWMTLLRELLSARHVALYAGIVGAYIVSIGILIRSETNIGLRHIDITDLAAKLKGMTSLFAVSTTPFEEWFDPASQVYLATVYSRRLAGPEFRYERVVLLSHRSARKDLDSDYLDGYHAKCFIDIHRRLGIPLYFVEWRELREIFRGLTMDEKIHIGLYPQVMARMTRFPRIADALMRPFERDRVRHVAVGVIAPAHGKPSAFRFSKHHRIISIEVQPPGKSTAYVTFAKRLKEKIYTENHVARESHDFTKYYG